MILFFYLKQGKKFEIEFYMNLPRNNIIFHKIIFLLYEILDTHKFLIIHTKKNNLMPKCRNCGDDFIPKNSSFCTNNCKEIHSHRLFLF